VYLFQLKSSGLIICEICVYLRSSAVDINQFCSTAYRLVEIM
jgi:hypothetical protein